MGMRRGAGGRWLPEGPCADDPSGGFPDVAQGGESSRARRPPPAIGSTARRGAPLARAATAARKHASGLSRAGRRCGARRGGILDRDALSIIDRDEEDLDMATTRAPEIRDQRSTRIAALQMCERRRADACRET